MFHRICISIIALCALGVSALPAYATSHHHGATFFSLATGQPLDTAYSPSQIQAAYNATPLYSRGITGQGQTVALIEVDGYRPADLQAFDTAYSLPAPVVQPYFVGAQRTTPKDQGETTMDLEWLHAMAPGAVIQIYYLKNQQVGKAGWKDLKQALSMAASHGARTISMSFGACGPTPGYGAVTNELAALMKRGFTVFVSSGDSGARPGPVSDCGRTLGMSYPGSDPSVVSVGGTSLQLNPDNTIATEAAWDLSGGGRAAPFARPPWQTAAQLPADNFRWGPDVAFLADPQTGVSVYYRGRWTQSGGTSLGAPAWAGIWALVRQSTIQLGKKPGAAESLLYRIGNSTQYSQAFHDVVDGGSMWLQAGQGWDPVTGWGSPNIDGLATAVPTLR
ncbi:MAG: S53 family peptidase [Chloroflexota bacterium]|nr:S53 family peptidase [Chloroflexota bacterium]